MRAYIAMLPRLTAEESNLARVRVAAGSGLLEDIGALVHRWERIAAGDPATLAPGTAAGVKTDVARKHGIGIHKVKRKPRPAPAPDAPPEGAPTV